MASKSLIYECAICGAKCFGLLLWKQHTKNHINPIKILIQCLKCPMNFSNADEFKMHTNNQHYHHKSTQTDNNDDDESEKIYENSNSTYLIKDEPVTNVLPKEEIIIFDELPTIEFLHQSFSEENHQNTNNTISIKDKNDEFVNCIVEKKEIIKFDDVPITQLSHISFSDKNHENTTTNNIISIKHKIKDESVPNLLVKKEIIKIHKSPKVQVLYQSPVKDESVPNLLVKKEIIKIHKSPKVQVLYQSPVSGSGNINTKQKPPKPMTKHEPCSCVFCGDLITDLMAIPISEVEKEMKKNTKFPCNICGRQMYNPSCFIGHRLRHYAAGIDERWVSCLRCKQEQFNTKGHKNSANLSIKCKYSNCNRACDNEVTLSKHYRDHIDRRVYHCTFCGKSAIGKVGFDTHMRYHKNIERKKRNPKDQTNHYECDICGKQLNCTKFSLISHLRRHMYSMTISCKFCGKSLQNINLKKHMTIYHNDRKPFICDICGTSFKFNHRLKHHISIKHTREQRYECSLCKRKFMLLESMRKHLLTHTGEKPLKCDQCDKRYRDSSDLRRHKRIHGGVIKPHVCDMCEQRFYEPKQLRKHKLSAHNIAN